jgi:error-prone DNA polymerase
MHKYVELHCHSNYSFQEGASRIEELVVRAMELGYPAMALTDHDNLCGALEFARIAHSVGIQPITGCEMTLQGGSHLTLLAATDKGYSNLCRLISAAHMSGDRRKPELDPSLLPNHAQGLILLTGCSKGEVPSLVTRGHLTEARSRLREYLDWFGSGNVFLEMQHNLVYGDTERNHRLVALGKELLVPPVATNNVHYHVRERHQLQDCLVAISHRKSLDETHRERRPNSECHLKSPQMMAFLFDKLPEAIENSLQISKQCSFDLSQDLVYCFPTHPVPEGFTTESYLEHLCLEAASRRYGIITTEVKERLDEEFRLVRKHNLSGFLLLYHEVIQLAREVQVDLGLVDKDVPIEEHPPGRGRGSSVSMLMGYLIGLSHIDPIQYGLSLERFLPEDALTTVPDIDLDFPRNIREELILRIHQKYGWNRAALTSMINTYQIKGAIRDLGKALGLPHNQIHKLARRVEHHNASDLGRAMTSLPEFSGMLNAPGWRDLVSLASDIDGFPKHLAQHPGGMIISSSPLIDMVPVQPSATEGRYICHWDKDSIDNAGFIKIDFLALGALSQMQDAVHEIEQRTGKNLDLSRINFNDPEVYAMLHRADTIGVFQVESAAQMQSIIRIRPKNLTDMAHEVAAVRPGVGANDGVRHYIRRRSNQEQIRFDHDLERHALERTLGIILFQDQTNQLAIDVAGFSPSEAEHLRRIFHKRHNEKLLAYYLQRFINGSGAYGVPPKTARRIFSKFNGQYMFPESHAFAFGVTAYQMSWLKYYYPLEFYLSIFNQQPMGFYSPETLKEDARRHGIRVLNPDINLSLEKCTIEENAICLGLLYVRNVGPKAAKAVVQERDRNGAYTSLTDVMERTGLLKEALHSLSEAGALDGFGRDRRALTWEIGLRYKPFGRQLQLDLSVEQDMAHLPLLDKWERMEGEYHSLNLYPTGHIMSNLRPGLPGTLTSQDITDLEEGKHVTVAGLVIRRQSPTGKTVFISLEDEFGHIPLIVWSSVHRRLKHQLDAPLLLVHGTISRKECAFNIVVSYARPIKCTRTLPMSKDWG